MNSLSGSLRDDISLTLIPTSPDQSTVIRIPHTDI